MFHLMVATSHGFHTVSQHATKADALAALALIPLSIQGSNYRIWLVK